MSKKKLLKRIEALEADLAKLRWQIAYKPEALTPTRKVKR